MHNLQLEDEKIKIDEDKFVEHFAVKEVAKKTEVKKVAKKKKEEKPSFLDASRAQNLNIVLNKLKLSTVGLANSIITYDETNPENGLTTERCEMILPIIPTKDEFDTVSKATENLENQDDFAKCDLFVVLVGYIPGCKERISSILFKNSYKKEGIFILENIDEFFKAFDVINNNKEFKEFLTIVLAIGNYVNGVSSKGGAYGFKLDSLPKIMDYKSKDGKTLLFDYIVEFIIKDMNKPEILSFIPEFDSFNNRKFYISLFIYKRNSSI